MSDDPHDTPLSRAIRRRKELQDAAKGIMKELEKIEEFLSMYRNLSGPEDGAIQGAKVESPRHILSGAGKGQTQEVFQQLVRSTLLEAGRPMRSPEIIDAFHRRGHPIGGNETRTAWNRLWKARDNGVLINIPQYGYWLADEPLPDDAMSNPPPKRKIDPERGRDIRGKGRRVGRQRLLSDGQIKLLEQWLAEGTKTRREMARDLGGISSATVNNYRLAILQRRKGQTVAESLTELLAKQKKPRR